MSRNRRSLVFSSILAIALVGLPTVASQAASSPRPGAKCTKAKQTVTVSGLKYTCTKTKGKLLWSHGVLIPSAPMPGQSAPSNDQQESAWLGRNYDITSTQSLVPQCTSSTPLTRLVTDAGLIESITPLGFVQSDAHNTTVPHLYFNTGSPNGSTDSNGTQYRSNRVPVYAPADMTISGIITTMTSPYTEYSIGAHVCGRLWIAFNHVDELSPSLQTAFNANKNIQNPQYNISLKAGDKIAMSSGRSAGFDFRAMDTSHATPTRLNPKAWSPGWTTAVCGLDWYESATKDALYAKLATKRTVNKCGEPAMDIAGTASGAWLPVAHPDFGNWQGESETFSLVQTNDDPSQYYSSIGGNTSVDGIKSQTYRYKINTTGLNNPGAENVKTGDVACIDDLIPQGPYAGEAYPRAYIQMTTAPEGELETILVASAPAGSCGTGPYIMPTHSTKFVRYNLPGSKFHN